jgi:Tfp pilus assembly protein PilN
MIRVNLLRNKVGDQTTATNASTSTSMGTSLASAATAEYSTYREVLIKVILLLAGVLALMAYENSHIASLKEQQINLGIQVSQLNQEVAAQAAEVESVKDIEVQSKELEDKLKILKLLSRLRLRELKTLDFMQSSIPEKVWLKSIHYEAAKDNMETGHFSFEGGAVTTEELTEFVKRLENSAYLADVIVIKNQEIVPNGKGISTRDYLFTAEVETQN